VSETATGRASCLLCLLEHAAYQDVLLGRQRAGHQVLAQHLPKRQLHRLARQERVPPLQQRPQVLLHRGRHGPLPGGRAFAVVAGDALPQRGGGCGEAPAISSISSSGGGGSARGRAAGRWCHCLLELCVYVVLCCGGDRSWPLGLGWWDWTMEAKRSDERKSVVSDEQQPLPHR